MSKTNNLQNDKNKDFMAAILFFSKTKKVYNSKMQRISMIMNTCLILHYISISLKKCLKREKNHKSNMENGSHFEFEETVFFYIKNVTQVSRLH